MPDTADHKLKVVLALKWVRGVDYDAKVSVTVPDSCYIAGDLKVGLAPSMIGISEIEYLTFNIKVGLAAMSSGPYTGRREVRDIKSSTARITKAGTNTHKVTLPMCLNSE
jgi:hypothetical protein